MSLYRLQRKDSNAPYPHGISGLYRGEAVIAEKISDEEAERRGLISEDGFPVTGWVWWPEGQS